MALPTSSYVAASAKSPDRYDRREAKRSNTLSSIVSPVVSIESRARFRRSSADQSSTATPTIGQSSRPRRSSRYRERHVITFARSPVTPKRTSTSAALLSSVARAVPAMSVPPSGPSSAPALRRVLVLAARSPPRGSASHIDAPPPEGVESAPPPRDVEQLEAPDSPR